MRKQMIKELKENINVMKKLIEYYKEKEDVINASYLDGYACALEMVVAMINTTKIK